MFGGGGAWGSSSNQNQQQQQQQQPQQQQQGASAFGQPPQQSAFGSAFGGGGGAFGQTNTQQPSVNPMFGGTSGSSNAFGGGSTSAFGAPKPSGFGTFGSTGTGTSAFGSGGTTGAFGQTNNTTGNAFGQPSTGTGAFGTGLFGQKPAATTTAFGSTSTGGATTGTEAATAPVTTGSSNPPYAQFSEKDTSAPGNVTLHYQSISTMPAYRGTSFEELRVQDYAQGRKTASATGTLGFGMQPSTSTSTFGQPAATTSTFGGFGQNTQSATQPTSAFGAFGQPNNTQQQPSTGFGSAFGGFGQNSQQQQQQQQQQQPATTSAFGSFGQNNQQQQPQGQTGTNLFGGFGQNNNANANQTKPFGAFGSTGTTGTSPFGGTGTSAFGQNNQQPNQTGTTGLFGQSQPQNQQGTSTTSLFGAFGQNNNNPPKPFGQTGTTSTFGTGLFGQNNQNQNQQPTQPSTGLFGNTNGTTGTGTGLFGQNNQQNPAGQQPQQQQGSTGLFGQPQNTNQGSGLFGGGTGTGLFGNNNNAPKPGAFGTGLFGQNNNQTANTGQAQPSTNLFGQPLGQPTNQSSTGFGNSLFGNKPATSFGQSTAQPASGIGSGLFGTSQLGQLTTGAGVQGAGTLTASVAEPVQANLPIFSLLQSNNQAPYSDPPPKKMSSFFIDTPTRSPLSLSSSRLNGSTRLRGFASSQSQSMAGLSRGNGMSSTMTLTRSSTPNSMMKSTTRGSLLGPEAFLGGGSVLGSDGRQSPKKLVLDRKMDPGEVFGRSAVKAAASTCKVKFNPAMGIAAREKEDFNVSVPAPTPSAPASPEKRTEGLDREAGEATEGLYYSKPSLDVLRSLSNTELSAFEGLVVGREGFGEVQFLEPVDLTTLPRLSSLLGQVVSIKKQEASVYPKSKDAVFERPPPPGEGLNVRTRFIIRGCWPVDKATGQPITDENNPKFQRAVERLKKTKHTTFEKFEAATGTWVFTVDHFT